ncbi:3-oxoacyl-[acyl-carrier-protein] synthase III C-terminal domain-containing protein [Pseudomonas sp. W4I3]|uniref:3-oxoacyl-[acyl-carrier-protein] synthase III C-terminal domain-containing protein n=1 Tax=Pseudomonas sp. W4I3 TaxID=3042294 RepID=UPI00277E8598|nr:3-oxoacyl-[acyl-carrier-protein] synthase III C-terminal domain-containing protein [Pseudomonas sp. W4I3]MDQ0741473.1 3-oxoacyl-[acyl-carrier-protein] synthase III [Pseudomonas sp. W4I3]
MLPLNYLCWLPDRISLNPLDTLEQSHDLKSGACKVLQRYYFLNAVALSSRTHAHMLVETLESLIVANPHLKARKGCLVYAKTQTHNTFFDNDWLHEVADVCGLGHWEVLSVSLNHCSSALSAVHLLKNRLIKRGEPMLLLTGEKAFHSAINRLDNSVLAEVPAVMLLNAGPAQWNVTHTAVRHMAGFYDNHRKQTPARRRELYASLEHDYHDFYLYAVRQFNVPLESIDAIVPCNLDLPMLKRVVEKLQFKGILFTEHIAEYGHAYCADILFNLSALLKKFTGQRILCLTMGMGVTLSCVLIERHQSSEVLHVRSSCGD